MTEELDGEINGWMEEWMNEGMEDLCVYRFS